MTRPREMRPPLQAALDALLARNAAKRHVTLDEIGDALGTMAVTTDEIDAFMTELENAGFSLDSPPGPKGEETLRTVLEVARALRAETGRNPSALEISARAGIPLEHVQHALALARVMSR